MKFLNAIRRYLSRHVPQKVKDRRATLAFIFLSVALVATGIWAYQNFMTSPPFVDPERYPVRGIDVSHHNGNIDFKKVADAGFDFVIIKASEGESRTDRKFTENFREAEEAGLATGAYHFFRFDCNGVPQARNFLKAIGDCKPTMGLVIDVEESGNPEVNQDLVRERLRAMTEYLNLAGHRVTVYTNREGYYEYVKEAIPGTSLWICSFNRIPIDEEWIFWQYDHHGRIPGINGDVDLNAFVGNREDWNDFLSEGTITFSEG